MISKTVNINFVTNGALPEIQRSKKNCLRCKEYGFVHWHHKVKRSAMGTKDDIIPLCPRCHEWVETHPREAMDEGWHVPFWKSSSYHSKYGKEKDINDRHSKGPQR